ncbi:hypothetical protein SPH9361_04134 [Sphingobium sp. CECT 9361]|nr:hypothetical protein SPH9361_04134 [Sphingobium sp. CECT 9361]
MFGQTKMANVVFDVEKDGLLRAYFLLRNQFLQ